MGWAETSPVTTLPWKEFAVGAVDWFCARPAGICAISRPQAKTWPKIASPSSQVQARTQIVLWLEYFDEIKVFYSQKCPAAQK
jgi:hypothetical protein